MARNKKSNNTNPRKGGKAPVSQRNEKNFSAIKKDKDMYNDPNYYFFDKDLAEQASQLSFQNMLGYGSIKGYEIPTIVRILMNPSPGVTVDVPEPSDLTEVNAATASPELPVSYIGKNKAGINLMCAKLYTMLSTYSGRSAGYAPQDVGSMILGISSFAELSEHTRRIFGVAMTYNSRNRSIPLGLIEALGVEPEDFIKNIAVYRMRFNVIMTRINQIPLLDNIGYIRKSRELYQHIFLDSGSPMAQTFFYAPYSVWTLDEESYEQGTILKTTPVPYHSRGNESMTPPPVYMSQYLDLLDTMVTKLLESSTLNLVYADLMNMASKVSVSTWQFDYLAENYAVVPEVNAEAILQFHNARIVGKYTQHAYRSDARTVVTPENDVYPDVETNNLVYSPCIRGASWRESGTKTMLPFWKDAIVDSPVANPDLQTRIEMLRFSCADSGYWYKETGSTEVAVSRAGKLYCALPDHWITAIDIFSNFSSEMDADDIISIPDSVMYRFDSYDLSDIDRLAKISQIGGMPIFFMRPAEGGEISNNTALFGDFNFYTTVDWKYLKRINDVIFTGLFEFRLK